MEAWPRIAGRNRPLVRADGSLQFGLEPEHGLRLDGLTPAEMEWVAGLDGTSDPVTRGAAADIAPDRVRDILRLLHEHLILQDPPEPTLRWHFPGRSFEHEVASIPLPRAYAAVLARADTCVRVQGRGALASTITDLLRQAGVGDLERDNLAATSIQYRRKPDVVVLAMAGPVDPEVGAPWFARGIPHLPVSISASNVSVGPLVVPGETPCLGCLDLVRADGDPSWRWLRQQAEAHGGLAEGESALGAIGAGLAARLVLAHLDHYPAPPGVGFEVSSPWPEPIARQWPRHVGCTACRKVAQTRATMTA